MEESAGKERIKLEQDGDLTFFLDAGVIAARFGSSADCRSHLVSCDW